MGCVRHARYTGRSIEIARLIPRCDTRQKSEKIEAIYAGTTGCELQGAQEHGRAPLMHLLLISFLHLALPSKSGA